jgi:hypothetical protein
MISSANLRTAALHINTNSSQICAQSRADFLSPVANVLQPGSSQKIMKSRSDEGQACMTCNMDYDAENAIRSPDFLIGISRSHGARDHRRKPYSHSQFGAQ